MKKVRLILIALLCMCVAGFQAGCGDDEPRDQLINNGGPGDDDDGDGEVLPPTIGDVQPYTPSLTGKPYKPINVKAVYTMTPSSATYSNHDTRIMAYMPEFTPDTTVARYRSVTNKYGSRTDKERHTATGRFYTKKIGNRWWIIDPEGYIHYNRSVNSIVKGGSPRSTAAWDKLYGTDEKWLAAIQEDFASIGFHGTAAFSSGTYPLVRTHNASNPDTPLTLAPSYGFLTSFRTEKGGYPGGNENNIMGLVYYDGWTDFCKAQAVRVLTAWKDDPNYLGFFSDNELNFGLNNENGFMLRRLLNIADASDPARLAAEAFMTRKGVSGAAAVTKALDAEFAGETAEIYYSAVKAAAAEVDPAMLYLGSRLHGEGKYMLPVVAAAGRHCDIISINYYARWHPELTSWIKDWYAVADKPFMVTEFYTKANESELPNTSGAGMLVPTFSDRAYAYQHFTLGLLEAPNCVGWHWFRYQDDPTTGNTAANKGIYNNDYVMYPLLAKYMKALNFNVYELIEYFDGRTY